MSRRANEGKVLRLNYVGAYETTKQDLVQAEKSVNCCLAPPSSHCGLAIG